MALSKTHVALAVFAALATTGCSYSERALMPSLSGEEPSGAARPAQPAAADAAPLPLVSETSVVASPIEALSVTPGTSTGTFVGQKVQTLRGDLAQLQATVARHAASLQKIRQETVEDSQRYHGTVAAINARLQVGTTPGNPVLMQQWYAAQNELDQINEDILKMNRLATEVASSSALSNYLLSSVQAARGLSGAVDEDHRQLRVLEDDVNRTIVSVERLLTDLSTDVNRQQQYLSTERSNLGTLALAVKNGQLYGQSLATTQFEPVAPVALSAPAGDHPLVVIRFTKPNTNYENQLYAAVKEALDRRPSASFDVVAVSPAKGSPSQTALGSTTARRNAEAVVRSLSNMGLPTNRIRLSARTADNVSAGEVHVFVR